MDNTGSLYNSLEQYGIVQYIQYSTVHCSTAEYIAVNI